jgi:hypothetical protein
MNLKIKNIRPDLNRISRWMHSIFEANHFETNPLRVAIACLVPSYLILPCLIPFLYNCKLHPTSGFIIPLWTANDSGFSR